VRRLITTLKICLSGIDKNILLLWMTDDAADGAESAAPVVLPLLFKEPNQAKPNQAKPNQGRAKYI
jgi:hypothetical protein